MPYILNCENPTQANKKIFKRSGFLCASMRILSLHPAATELLFSIGASDLLVGRTDECIYPEQARKVPSIGPHEDVSEVLVDVFEPDLVITGRGQQDLATDFGAGHKVVYFDPQSLEDLYAGISSLGELLGKQVEADMLVHDIRVLLERLCVKAARFHSTRVYCEGSHEPLAATGYVMQLIEMAGGQPYRGPVTIEHLEKFNPQMIVSAVPEEDDFDFELMMARPGWSNLNAVQTQRLFSLPSSLLYRPGPRLIEGIKRIARILHGIELNGNGI